MNIIQEQQQQQQQQQQRKINLSNIINLTNHPIHDKSYIHKLKQLLQINGVITLPSFILPDPHSNLLQEAKQHQHLAYYTKSTHNVYLTPIDKSLPLNHPFNRQVISSKGCITTDQIPSTSILKSLYYNNQFQLFCADLVNVAKLYPYEDPLSEINIHYYQEGQELGWHFDNSSFAITLLLQGPINGGHFEYIPNLRTTTRNSSNKNTIKHTNHFDEDKVVEYDKVNQVLDGKLHGQILDIDPCTLVIFRGRESLHRVSPIYGNQSRILVVFAYNDQPGVSLSEEARMTFFGRTGTSNDNKN